MSKAKQQTPRSGVASPKATPRGEADPSQPVQLSVLVLQADALEHDEAVREELKRGGFVVKQQALVHLSADAARQFILEVCNSHSAMYRVATPHESETEAQDGSAGGEGHGGDTNVVTETHSSLDTASDDNEMAEHTIHALASGPALVLSVEKPNAVAELLQLVGPADPAAWTETSHACLRARFAKDAPRKLGLRCSAQELTAAHELAFLLAHSGNKVHAHAGQGYTAMIGDSAPTKSAAMGLEQLLNFVFPEHLQHSTSAGRLFVFALYGPLDAHSRLRSGEKGLHVVTDRELSTMSARMEREDILAVYGMCSLSQEEEEEVVRQVDRLLKRFPQYTPRDMEALFAALPRDCDGKMSFHDMQRAVLKERLRRVVCMKERLQPALAEPVRNQFACTLTRLSATKSAGLVNGAPASLFLKDVGATNVENAALVSRLLSTRAFQMCHMEDGNSPQLTQNVRLLRPDKAQKLTDRDPWNANCQKRSHQ